jgi:hypothetical protein
VYGHELTDMIPVRDARAEGENRGSRELREPPGSGRVVGVAVGKDYTIHVACGGEDGLQVLLVVGARVHDSSSEHVGVRAFERERPRVRSPESAKIHRAIVQLSRHAPSLRA